MMNGFNEEDVWENFWLSPAEKALIIEQLEAMTVAANHMKEAAKSSDGKVLREQWTEICHASSYLNSILQARSHIAIHRAAEGPVRLFGDEGDENGSEG